MTQRVEELVLDSFWLSPFAAVWRKTARCRKNLGFEAGQI
jgi:hypothetical protein